VLNLDKLNSKYRLVPQKSDTSIKRAPVLDIVYNNNLILQIAFNIAHKKSQNAYFSSLAGNNQTTQNPNFFNNTNLKHIFNALYYIQDYDSSFSTLQRNKLSHFSISFQDPRLENILEQESKACFQERVHKLVSKYGYKGNREILSKIKTPKEYLIMLTILSQREDDYSLINPFIRFHNELFNITKTTEEQIEQNQEQIDQLKEMQSNINQFDKNSAPAVKFVKAYEEFKKALLGEEIKLSSEKLQKIYDQFIQNPNEITLYDRNYQHLFSEIVKFKKNLHSATNTQYNPQIVSFSISENFTRYKKRKEKQFIVEKQKSK
jgi:hypothetical protein